MACIEIVAENKTAEHVQLEVTHVCGVNTDGYIPLYASDGLLRTIDNKILYVKIR